MTLALHQRRGRDGPRFRIGRPGHATNRLLDAPAASCSSRRSRSRRRARHVHHAPAGSSPTALLLCDQTSHLPAVVATSTATAFGPRAAGSAAPANTRPNTNPGRRGMRDKRPEIRQKGGTACPPPIGRQMRFGSAKSHDFRGFPSAPERTRTSTDHSVHRPSTLHRACGCCYRRPDRADGSHCWTDWT